MKKKLLQRWNNALHRDLGYLCFGMTIIYALSGIILNHFKSGDFSHPDYSKSYQSFQAPLLQSAQPDKAYALSALKVIGQEDHYKSHLNGVGSMQIFLTTGSVGLDLTTGAGMFEKRSTRYVLKEFNLLHYNNLKHLYTWFSDLYAVALILLAITGLFILRGRNGILRRGAWLTALGIILPAVFLLLYA
jgi:uncharacterized protein